MDSGTGKVIAKILLIADTHITTFNNPLLSMVDAINDEPVDMVIALGDIANDSTKQTLTIASDTLDKIKHSVFVIPGDYDNGVVWQELFGGTYKATEIGGYSIDLLDTSFMGHRFAVGWGDVMDEYPEQRDWLLNQLGNGKQHLIFSHHPMYVKDPTNNMFCYSNIRAAYAGHMHDPFRQTSKSTGLVSVPLPYHGNLCYFMLWIKDTGAITGIPKMLKSKVTRW